MTNLSMSRALEIAVAAARDAGAVLLSDFHREGGPRGHGPDKADADLEAENLIRDRLTRAFPSWGYLGEETGQVRGQEGQPVWLVDPNDGTRDYLLGRRGSSVSIGLVTEGRPLLGVVFAFGYPDDSGVLYVWAEDCGPVTRNGLPVAARLPVELSPNDIVLVSSGADRRPQENLRGTFPARFRSVPSIAHRLALLAAGEAAAAISLFAPGAWDYAAGHALVRGSGGVLLDQDGNGVSYDDEGRSQCQRAFAGSAWVARSLRDRDWRGALEGPVLGFPWPQLPPGRSLSDSGLLSRAQGSLLGQIAGDSLGSLVEFESSAKIAARFEDGPRELADGGVWGTLAGQPTDDSEMALTLARSILRSGRFDSAEVFAAYRSWRESHPFDMGGTTKAALDGYPKSDSQANGSLMRVSPLAIYAHALDPAEAAALARTDSSLTHPHPVCCDAVACYVVALSHALRNGDGPASTWQAAVSFARRSGVQTAVLEALLAAEREPRIADAGTQGFVLIALQNAFHDLLTAPSLESGVVASVRRGGDTDTNAAIAGALLGAVHGRDAVPRQWTSQVLSCRPIGGRGQARPPELWPIDALTLAELLLLAGREAAGRA